MPKDNGTGGVPNTAPSTDTQDQQQKIVDHFEGIDLDELPDNVRGAVAKSRESITTLSTNFVSAEQKRQQVEAFARTQQSRADKLNTVVVKHNLNPDGTPPGNLADAKHQERVARITADNPGIKPEVAEAYARMLGKEAEVIKKELLADLAPLANNVNHVNASQVLSAKELEKSEFFGIPEVGKMVRDNVAVLVQQGSEVSGATVDHLLNMAYGQYIIGGGKAPVKSDTQIPNLSGNNLRGGGHTRLPANNDDKTPPTTDPQTTSIMSAINVHMRQGMPVKK